MPVHRGSFRVTHRFGRPVGLGDFGDLASEDWYIGFSVSRKFS
jgi:hypothetical protein